MTIRPRLIALVAACAALAACGGEPEPQAPPPPEVGVVQVQPQAVPLTRDLVGRLGAYRTADVRARVPGVLQKRMYTEGSDVAEGEVLFLVDPAPYRADLGAAQAALSQAQANAANARAAAERARTLAPQHYISRADLDNALAAERSADAAVASARAALDSAQISLGYATVRAPIAGRAGMQQVTEGALVGQGEPTLLTTIDQVDPLYVNFSMSVSELQDIREAGLAQEGPATVRVVLGNGREYAHAGEIDFSGDVVDPGTGAVSLRAVLPNPDRQLLPGAYVSLKATLGTQQDQYLVPQAAVQRDANGAFVMVVGQDGLVARRDVGTGRAQDGQWIIGQGLSPGDQVIVSGLQRVQAGAPATAVPWTPTPAPANGAPADVPASGPADAPADAPAADGQD